MELDVEGLLTRDEVEDLLRTGTSWRLSWCWGAHRDPESGRGLTLPEGTLPLVPTASQLRRYRLGKTRKTFVLATVVQIEGADIVNLTEMGA